MPLSKTIDRELMHSRDIRCDGYLRADGLWDIEGVLCDTKTYALEHSLRQRVEAGAPTHDMKVRITIGDDRVIRSVDVAMDAYAFPDCPGAEPNYQRLAGLDIGPGFTKKLHELVGHSQGCTHVSWLFQCIARVALQTLTRQVTMGQISGFDTFFGRRGESNRPALVDSCHAYAVGGQVVKILFPEHYSDPDAQD